MVSFATLRRWWVGVSLWQGLLLVHALVYATGTERGGRFFVLLAGVVAVALAVIAFTLAITPPRLDWLRRRLGPFVWWGVLAGWGGLFVFGLELRPEWIYAHIGLSLAAILTLVVVTLKGTAPLIERPRRWLVAGLVAVVAITALRVAGLSVYPPLHVHDEGWTLGWAVEYNDTGVLSNRLIGYPQDQSVVRLYMLLAWWLRVAGTGLWEARLFVFMLMPVVILFSAWAAHNLYGRRTAWFTSLFLFCSVIFMTIARVRHDIGLALAVAVSLWLYSEARKRSRLWLHGLAGLVMGWGAFGHYNAIPIGVVMVIGLYVPHYLVRLRQGQRWPEAAVWFYGLGGLIAGLHVAVVQVWPTYASTSGFMTFEHPTTPLALLNSSYDQVYNLAALSQFEFILVVLGLGAALWRRRLIDWSLVLLVLLSPLALAMLAAGSFPYYPIQLTPFYGLVIGSLFDKGLARTPSDVPTGQSVQPVGRKSDQDAVAQVAFVAVMAVMIISLGSSLAGPLRHVLAGAPLRLPPPPPAQWVLDHVEPGATVVGEHHYYLWLFDYRFLSPTVPITPGWYPKDADRFAGMSQTEIWDVQVVDVFIVDPATPTDPILQWLVEEEYFETGEYELAAQFGTVSIYVKADPGA